MSYAIGAGGISGGFDGIPAFQTIPPIASSTASLPIQSRYGPVWPKSLMRRITSFGKRSSSAPKSMPSDSR